MEDIMDTIYTIDNDDVSFPSGVANSSSNYFNAGSNHDSMGAVGAGYGNITISDPGYGNITAGGTGGLGFSNGFAGTSYQDINTTQRPSAGVLHINKDVVIDGRSMRDFMESMEQRLAILVPDPKKLEHFESLQKAYAHYKTLEALCELPTEKTDA